MNYNIEEELFCTNFELRNLTDLVLYGKAERWVFKFMHNKYEKEHLNRYNYALPYSKDNRVLDIACGCGYGSYLLATEGEAKIVIGVDLDEEAIRYGNYRYSQNNLQRFQSDAVTFKHEDKFDLIISFETIEHIPNYLEFIENLYENLEDDGVLLISTPITQKTNTNPNNPFHVIEWNFFDFHKLFIDKFIIVDIILQDIIIQNENKRQKYTLKNRILNRISTIKSNDIEGKDIEPYKKQYNMNLCNSGYQLLVLKKIL